MKYSTPYLNNLDKQDIVDIIEYVNSNLLKKNIDEVFFENVEVLDRLKLRASIGNPGNQNFSSYQSYTTYVFNNWNQHAFGASMIVSNFGNPDLEWQKTMDRNVGFDLTMWNNRFNVNFDYYDKETDPLLASISVPSSVGVTEVMTNIGGQRTQGVSGTVKYSPLYRGKTLSDFRDRRYGGKGFQSSAEPIFPALQIMMTSRRK